MLNMLIGILLGGAAMAVLVCIAYYSFAKKIRW